MTQDHLETMQRYLTHLSTYGEHAAAVPSLMAPSCCHNRGDVMTTGAAELANRYYSEFASHGSFGSTPPRTMAGQQ